MKKFALLAIAGVACAGASADVLWDNGAPHPVNFNGTDTNLGYSSGNLGAGLEQRWIAAPFRITSPGTVIDTIEADWFIVAGSEAETVNYIIWNRNGLVAPVAGDEFSSGVLGAYGAGVDDPRTAAVDDWLHIYSVNIPIPVGDYYLTIYGDGGAAPNNVPWLTGGDLQDEALEQQFMWRSATFPAGGFQQYAPANILPGAGMTDPDDRWNPSFRILGIPEPASLALLSVGALLFVRRR